MYAGVGRTNSSNVNSNPVESVAEIPEWKRLLIMRKRAGALAVASPISDETNAKTAVITEPVYSHFRNPVPSGGHGNLSGNCNVITGYGGDSDLPPGLRFSSMLRSSTPLTSVECDRSHSESSSQDTVIRTIGNITVELRTVYNRTTVLENGEDCGDCFSPPILDRFPLMSPSSSEPVYATEEDLENGGAEDLHYGPGIVDKLRAKFLNLGRQNRRRPVVRKFSSLENLSPGAYGTIRAIGPHNKLLKGEYRQSGIRATNLNQHSAGSNFKKAQSMETLLVGSAASLTPDSNFGLRRGRLFIKSLSPGFSAKFSPETTITPPRSLQDSKKRFEYSRQVSGSNIKEDELPKPDTVKQVKKIFESPAPTNSNDGRSCHTVINQHPNEKQNCQSRTNVLVTPTCSAGKASPPFNSIIAVSGNLRPRKVSPASTIVSTPSSTILEEEIPPTNDDSAKQSNEVNGDQVSNCTNGLLDGYGMPEIDSGESPLPPFSSKLINETVLILEREENNTPSLSNIWTSIGEGESLCAKSSDSRNFLSEQEESPTDSEDYNDSAKVKSVSAERVPPIEQNNDCSGERKEQSSQGSQVTAEPEQDYRVTSVTPRKPHPHQPDSPTAVSILNSSVEEEYHYDEVCEDDQEEDMVVASTSPNGSPPHHLRTLENQAAVAPQCNTNILNFSKKPSNWQKPPQSTTSVVFDFRGKDVKPNISLNPTPFGCKPAKVKKRAGSPPRGDTKVVNGVLNNDSLSYDVEDNEDEDWDEMDIGADLPASSGIVFDGENIKVGRGALLENRNKKLSIQFDDQATATYEYPCESPIEDYATDDTASPAIKYPSIGSHSTNSNLSSYTPHVLGNSDDFQLGVSRAPTHRPPPPVPTRSESPIVTPEAIVPADPDDTAGWSAADTSDILF